MNRSVASVCSDVQCCISQHKTPVRTFLCPVFCVWEGQLPVETQTHRLDVIFQFHILKATKRANIYV